MELVRFYDKNRNLLTYCYNSHEPFKPDFSKMPFVHHIKIIEFDHYPNFTFFNCCVDIDTLEFVDCNVTKRGVEQQKNTILRPRKIIVTNKRCIIL